MPHRANSCLQVEPVVRTNNLRERTCTISTHRKTGGASCTSTVAAAVTLTASRRRQTVSGSACIRSRSMMHSHTQHV
ncbi:hypothetical protein OESDEN_15138 [Oesophagostomum dentatum]|uniref:Uncharacterized protein n=1 Tax=Oesophagostomum dentatum TaxID=61180 RepID=A0A0B1SPR7_OESDE|nr:hypothetical protein OESDEN_15138 [Oesophagostomum dentatum]